MPDEILLFVGGPVDGERRAVPRGVSVWSVSVMPKPLPPARGPFDDTPMRFERAIYRRESLRDGAGEFYYVMCADDAMSNLIRRLIEGYRKEVKS